MTATQSPAQSSDESAPPPLPATPTAPAQEAFTSDSLATTADVRVLDKSAHWSTVLTSSDFGDDQPVSDCIASAPSEKRADHYWVRRFSAGRGADAAQASQALEVAPSADVATKTYEQLLTALGTCRDGGRQLLDYRVVDGVGDRAGVFTFRYVDGKRTSEEIALLARTGLVVETWVVQPRNDSVRARKLLRVAGRGVDTVCGDAEGACSSRPYEAVDAMPPAGHNPGGFLDAVDLPVFGGIAETWAATSVATVKGNPSATNCDDADLTGGGAARVTTRSYVVPGSKQLPPVFGMTETIGSFASSNAARAFMSTVYKSVRKCEDRQLNLAVRREAAVHAGKANGRVWQIKSAASESTSFVYRVGLVRVGDTVAEVTFTPSRPYDVAHAQYVRLIERAGQRLAQAQPS